MRVIEKIQIVRLGKFSNSEEFRVIEQQIEDAITQVVWPPGADGFYLNPNSKGKGRGEGNGVKPIKNNFIFHLKEHGWKDEKKVRPKGVAGTGPLDAVYQTTAGVFAVEWETGNISSSHRALNKICLGVLNGDLVGGSLVLPSNELYPFLTDRIGNIRELMPYLPLWKCIPYKKGVIIIYVVEQDGFREGVERIPKGTDGRAIV